MRGKLKIKISKLQIAMARNLKFDVNATFKT